MFYGKLIATELHCTPCDLSGMMVIAFWRSTIKQCVWDGSDTWVLYWWLIGVIGQIPMVPIYKEQRFVDDFRATSCKWFYTQSDIPKNKFTDFVENISFLGVHQHDNIVAGGVHCSRHVVWLLSWHTLFLLEDIWLRLHVMWKQYSNEKIDWNVFIL